MLESKKVEDLRYVQLHTIKPICIQLSVILSGAIFLFSTTDNDNRKYQ